MISLSKPVLAALVMGAASLLGCNSERTIEDPVDEPREACTAWCELMRDCYGAVADECVEDHCLPQNYRFPACDELATAKLYCWADLSCEEYRAYADNPLAECHPVAHDYAVCVGQEADAAKEG